ncbi:AfsR/SARP family transcriptional regulator [Streptomyces sp. NBC_00690]|uniref:AfsR/SARP family transcriptional regulator n=1 Tax=Streptomyces sp. NBC_00690 TaxID=2975808 RepID=UPI002E2CC6C3|nr:AfsR/SARP family transcriptional regulator [Streptomyces sp. NBC_00690]
MTEIRKFERIRIEVLGSLRLVTEADLGEPVRLTAPKPRQMIALLALQANRVVSVAALAEELWGDRPPVSMRTALQTYVVQIRKFLARHLGRSTEVVAHEILVTKQDGYQFNVERGDLDVHEFERLASAGSRALAEGNDVLAERLLTASLDFWRGQPLADVQAGPLLEPAVAYLKESRLAVLQQRVEIRLRLGLHHELPAELAALVLEHPTNEEFHAQYMLALYRCGRCADALNVYHRLREYLVEELGIDPSMKVQKLHQAMLDANATLDWRRYPRLDSTVRQGERPAA